MRDLRIQLLVSHLVLVVLMLIVMIGAVVNFFHLGRSIDRILKDNYASVIAAEEMKETLERQDSAATSFLDGRIAEARAQYQQNRPLFEKAYSYEAHNITETGEQELADDIGQKYAAYRQELEKLLFASPARSKQAADRIYVRQLLPDFLHLKGQAQAVLDLNQKAILRANGAAKTEARTASSTGLGVTVAAFLLALFFASWTIRAALDPLRTLARQAEEIGRGHLNQRIVLNRTDEIGGLADSFNTMAEKLREARKQEEARLRRAERMSEEALENLYDPVIVTDAQSRIVHLNKTAEGLFGAAARVAGIPIGQVISDKRIVEAVDRAIHQESVSAAEDEAGFIPLTVGEAKRTYRLRTTPMRDEESTLLGAVVVLEDITHLRELDRLKTEFIGVASHELRTPVTSLQLSVQLLEEGAVGALTPEQCEIVSAQKEDLERLERMMGDLLDITRLEAGVTPPRVEIVLPQILVKTAVNAVATQAERQGLALSAEVLPRVPAVRADAGQIQRVLLNLLNNAIRHTSSGGAITVSATAVGKQVVLTVKDTGSGIPAEYLPKIFDRFVQVPGATRGGAGLGLSIAKTIIEAHGGTIIAESAPGQGSKFQFSLPIAD
ncbi:MAG: Alginate biosynthesis sensor protein KinB [Chthonomonadaceae bacterium]|nr:Alginate biosynthesis sensor protein KinB [Chthonomonadaceae bacterium]